MAYKLKMLLKKKSDSYFFGKNTCELNIVLTRTVNILITNELVKLTMLWTTGPSFFYNKKQFMQTFYSNTNVRIWNLLKCGLLLKEIICSPKGAHYIL